MKPRPPSLEAPSPLRHADRRLAAPRDLLLPAIRVSAGERRQIDGEAEHVGLALATYLRRVILGRRVPRAVPPINRELWAKLGALAADLNVIAEAAGEGRYPDDPLPVLAGLRGEIAVLRQLLVGDDPAHR